MTQYQKDHRFPRDFTTLGIDKKVRVFSQDERVIALYNGDYYAATVKEKGVQGYGNYLLAFPGWGGMVGPVDADSIFPLRILFDGVFDLFNTPIRMVSKLRTEGRNGLVYSAEFIADGHSNTQTEWDSMSVHGALRHADGEFDVTIDWTLMMIPKNREEDLKHANDEDAKKLPINMVECHRLR